jgi:predicted nucleic acid-binding protein
VLVDTSVWVDHLRAGDTTLAARLEEGEVECHPFVIGELSCGCLRRREEILDLLRALPAVTTVDHNEAMMFVDRHRLAGLGIGWIDAHLLASAALVRTTIWSRDGRLRSVARRLGLAAELR